MDIKMMIIRNGIVLGGGLAVWFFLLMSGTSVIAFLAKKHSNDLEFDKLFVGLRSAYHCLMATSIVIALVWVNRGT
jgi:hypothetical protein